MLTGQAAAAGDAATIEAVPREIAQLSLIQQMMEVLPAADLLLGGAMLIIIMLIHATSIRFATNLLVRRSEITRWRRLTRHRFIPATHASHAQIAFVV